MAVAEATRAEGGGGGGVCTRRRGLHYCVYLATAAAATTTLRWCVELRAAHLDFPAVPAYTANS